MTTTPPAPPKNRTLMRPATVKKSRSKAMTWVPPIVVFLALLGIWYAITFLVLDEKRRFLMPPPHEVVAAFFDPATFGEILVALGRTTAVALVGLAIAMVIGIVWAIAMSQAKWVERSLYPYAVVLQCIPILALVPLIGFWFGFEYPARIIVCVMIALFPMVSNTLFGLQSVDPGQRELFQLQRANRWTVLTKLEFPAALPAIFAGMRISAGLAVVGAIVGDFFFRRGEPGLGSLLSTYTARLRSAELFATIFVAALLGVAIFALFGWIGKRAVGRWYDFSA
ncbi:ABC transporter permease [Herbiconiux flava]|uniref:NitT/TauT family transport system permease protein n=1 Tax=Herbiconiux flava TaxID=881268 RepID=A0A852ST68_9MICO|nr:ABC transporter permease [Herbiconiux flava]NYD71945.1 NitT/TauT family transport system permease protein [Herbiconiux flava]GLK18092.1 nitrate ABC transporter permease [Herbiconiux flava]